jgi:alpha-ketoglutarate-dependent taurine dioxygenase
MNATTWDLRALSPFGMEVTVPPPGDDIAALPGPALRDYVARHRLLVLRGVRVPSDDAMMDLCRQLGEVLEWEFGAVNELKPRADAPNYLYTNRAVPFHWDGAFVGRVPHYIFFHCRAAPPEGAGGATTFCDTTRVLGRATPEQRRRWEGITVTYNTDKVVHYGGTFTAPLLGRHPVSGEAVLRYAEPVEDLNPVRLEVQGLPPAEVPAFLEEMRLLLYDPAACYDHVWRTGDVVLADNHALLHGRRAFTQAAPRHLRRVNIL